MSKQATPYDVIVVGSGASGGWAAKRLAEAGVNVALVEAGRAHKPGESYEHMRPHELPYANLSRELLRKARPKQTDCYACTEHNAHWFVNDHDEPYTTPAGRPFSWQGRTRMVGGRTNVWGRQSYRFSQQDLKGVLVRRRRRRLAARLRRSGAVLRPCRAVCRYQRASRRRAGVTRQSVPAADGDALLGEDPKRRG